MHVRHKGGGGHGGGSSNRKQRVTSFRTRHKVGQVVRGRIMTRDSASLYWINIQGDELLVDLGGSVPSGSIHTFHIESLDPVVVLKLVKTASSGAGSTPLHSVVAHFMDSKRKHARNLDELSESHPRRRDDHTRMLELEHDINETLFAERPGFFRWLPDLCTETGGAECLAIPMAPPAPEGTPQEKTAPMLWQVVIDFEPAPGRHAQARIFFKHPKASYRLFLDFPQNYPVAERAEKLLTTLLPDMEINCLGIQPMHGRTMKIMQYFLSPGATLNTFLSSSI